MFVDELIIKAKAGHGGDGVVRWRREKFIPKGGPAGGDGGRGADVYMRAVRDLNLLSKYTGSKEFEAENGHSGDKKSKHGSDGEDMYIDVPMGATVTDIERGRVYTFFEEGEVHKILKGGRGGLGNEHFKSSTNQAPLESTKGREGEKGEFRIELSLIVDVGFVGLPNAGKSTMINALTNTQARVGAYPFTTLEPRLGNLYGFVLADIPGLIEGASEGKGLGHKFLRHIQRTKMILHCVSLEHEDPYAEYQSIRGELGRFDNSLLKKEEWVLLTKSDLVLEEQAQAVFTKFSAEHPNVFVVSAEAGEGIKDFADALVRHLRALSTSAETPETH
jgi:GTP-binding protein